MARRGHFQFPSPRRLFGEGWFEKVVSLFELSDYGAERAAGES